MYKLSFKLHKIYCSRLNRVMASIAASNAEEHDFDHWRT